MRSAGKFTTGALVAVLGGAAHGASFIPLEPINGGYGGAAWSVSADGSVVVGSNYTTSQSEAFRWTSATGMVGLGWLSNSPSANTYGDGVSADGNVIVGRADAPITHGRSFTGFRWTTETGLIEMGDPATGYSSQQGASADGSVIVGVGLGSATRWTAATGIQPLSGPISQANAVSADGNTVVGQSNLLAVMWTPGSSERPLGRLPGPSDISDTATGVSADGHLVVGTANSPDGLQAFRWSESEGMVGLGAIPGTPSVPGYDPINGYSAYSKAYGVSGDGSIIVGANCPSCVSGSSGAFIWTATGGMQDLKDLLVAQGATGLDEWTLTAARAISQDGRTIVGEGLRDGSVFTEGWIATLEPVPIPGAAFLFPSALGLLGWARRKPAA